MRRLLLLAALFASACATAPRPPPVDPAIAQYSSSARAAFERGDAGRAASFYEKALQHARARDERAEIAGLAYNLAACRILLGRTDGVAALLVEAREERRRAGVPADDLDLLDANRLRTEGQPAEARALALRVAENAKDPALAREAWLFTGLVAAQAGDAGAVEQAVVRAGDAGGALPAYLRGAALLLRDRPAEAAPHFDRAADAYRDAGRPIEMTDALARAADCLARAGRGAEAADRHYRAARSAHARGDETTALAGVEGGLSALGDERDSPTRATLLALLDDIRRSVEAAKRKPSP
jgi:tetratricopeptide (TPR) repeat protein